MLRFSCPGWKMCIRDRYKLTSMETSFAVNMLAIHDNRPKTLAMLDAINFYIEHRRDCLLYTSRCV